MRNNDLGSIKLFMCFAVCILLTILVCVIMTIFNSFNNNYYSGKTILTNEQFNNISDNSKVSGKVKLLDSKTMLTEYNIQTSEQYDFLNKSSGIGYKSGYIALSVMITIIVIMLSIFVFKRSSKIKSQ